MRIRIFAPDRDLKQIIDELADARDWERRQRRRHEGELNLSPGSTQRTPSSPSSIRRLR